MLNETTNIRIKANWRPIHKLLQAEVGQLLALLYVLNCV